MQTHQENKSLKGLLDLKGRAALIIGGTGYLGIAMSEALAEAGARVAVGSRSRQRADATVQQLPGVTDLHLGLRCDAANEKCIRQCVDQAAKHFGRLDILVNSIAGGASAGLDRIRWLDMEESLGLNLIGPFIASQQAAVHMRRVRGGSIIHVGSMYGVVSSYPQVYEGIANSSPPAYHAAKAALIHLTRYQAVYWAKDNIRVNCLSPGPFPRPVQHAGRAEFLQRLADRVPLGRCGVNWEIKGPVVFLASEASSFITGHNLVIDGGWTAW
jgi:NAD(P)-dependent dehydrogenase (short-subunit alcohol dehydrogenase family)